MIRLTIEWCDYRLTANDSNHILQPNLTHFGTFMSKYAQKQCPKGLALYTVMHFSYKAMHPVHLFLTGWGPRLGHASFGILSAFSNVILNNTNQSILGWFDVYAKVATSFPDTNVISYILQRHSIQWQLVFCTYIHDTIQSHLILLFLHFLLGQNCMKGHF